MSRKEKPIVTANWDAKATTDHCFQRCDEDEEYVPSVSEASSSQTSSQGQEEYNMNGFRDIIANALMAMRE